ncbi:hypothetical protein ES705_35771 [subsurface metagenome]
MSTRCLVSFGVISGDSFGGVDVYKHYDGQPKNMVPFLKEFIEWNKGEGETETDPGSIGANFIYWAKMEAKKRKKPSEEDLGKFMKDVGIKGHRSPVGNYTIDSPKIKHLMPLKYLYTVNYFLKTPKQFEGASPLGQTLLAAVDKIVITVGEPIYKDIVEDKEGMPLLEMEGAKAIDTIEIKRGEGEKNE